MSDKYTEAMGKRGAARLRKEKRASKVGENAILAAIVNPEAGVIYGTQEGTQEPLGGIPLLYPVTLPDGTVLKPTRYIRRRAPWAPKKARKAKSPSLSKLKKALWKEISLLVRSWSPVCLGCMTNPTECAGHVVPANSGGATAYFLANLVPMCFACNGAELRHRGEWVYRFKQILGDDVVDALYQFNKESKDQSSPYFWQVKRWWVLEQTDRMRKLRGEA